jgi:hypothetical protein
MSRINHILLLLILLDFPHGLPDYLFSVLFFKMHLRSIMNPSFHPQSVCPSANLPSFHLPHTETHQWGPHPSSVFQAHYALHGQPISHWGTCFCICTFLPNYSLFIVQMPLFSVVTLPFFFVTFGDLLPSFLASRNPCHPWLEHYLSSSLSQHRPYLQSTPQVTYLYPLNLFTLSHLWHNLSPVLSSP